MSDRRFWRLFGKTTSIVIISLAIVITLTPLKLACSASDYQWANVCIGGGSFVTGIYLHPLE